MNNYEFLERCLYHLIKRAKDNSIYFPASDTLIMPALPEQDPGTRPVDRYIHSVQLNNNNLSHYIKDCRILVWVVTPAKNGRKKSTFHKYALHQFNTEAIAEMLERAIQYAQI